MKSGYSERQDEMKAKVSAAMRWVGPAAMLGAALVVISDQVGLVVHLPEMGNDSMGYHAVGSGLFLLIFTLLLVGMFGLYARRPEPGSQKVIEYGDSRARYVLVTESKEEPFAAGEFAGAKTPVRRGPEGRGLAARRHRMVRGSRRSWTQRTAGSRVSGGAQQK